ncbi:hypothetical protein CMV_008152 [Castanea mollissima]|uniref:valine--tRNA ligase n=1 Tax=Castanea mollissima TaxID=60419 RepID=A0A8J4W2B0_9ROSI|nr:hypothetical protein CMV_008152 [Castanea mollissima]
MDHAGIATQIYLVYARCTHYTPTEHNQIWVITVVVEKKIMRERKLTRHDIGREKFVSEVWDWKIKYGGTILQQLCRLGASLDWSCECFTMDEKRSRAVTEAFVRLYKEKLVHSYLFLKVEHIEIKERTLLNVPVYEKPVEFGVLTSFAYPLEGELGEIVVATTRVDTMLGDTAIAIHPDDPRYNHLHGKFAIHPFNGRKLPIVCDATLVDLKFGTGAVKITPAHDLNDFEFKERHNWMPRFKAREAVIESLQKKGLYRGAKGNEMCLGICSKTNDVVEPLSKPQWYVKCNSMARQALDAVEDKKIEIIPKQWLENIRDWCVSRQLWWGHCVPAWYVTLEDDELKELGAYNDRDHWVVARNEDEAQEEASRKYNGKKFLLNQDPDVLDTWFSSGLFPLTVLGWPDDTEDLKAFFPISVLETGHDILFFWVALMVMLGMKLGGESGDEPFRKVYLHPMIRDAHGRKMSKSLRNVIDPLEVINGISLEGLHKRLEEGNLDPKELTVAKEGQMKDFPNGIPECGTDALRFALISYTAQSDKINLDIQRVVGYCQWCNKLWNAVRFAISKFGNDYVPPANKNYGSQTVIESIMMCKYPSIVEGCRNKRVEYDMDLVDSAVKSLRSLANERCERRAAFVLCRDSEFAEIIKSHELEIITLANLSSLRVISENDVTTAGCANLKSKAT